MIKVGKIEIIDKSSKIFLSYVDRDAKKIAANVMFVILLFVQHLMQNTWEVKKHLENEQLKEMNIPESLFQEPIEKKLKTYIMLKHEDK